jgi:hypothetical protein
MLYGSIGGMKFEELENAYGFGTEAGSSMAMR